MKKSVGKDYYIAQMREFVLSGRALAFEDILNIKWQQDMCSYIFAERGKISDNELILVINLREVLRNIPVPPTKIPLGFESFAKSQNLEMVNEYTYLGKHQLANRQLFIEVTGGGREWKSFTLIDGINVVCIEGVDLTIFSEQTLRALISDVELLDVVVSFGVGTGLLYYPLFYSTVDEFLYESFSSLRLELDLDK